eukprot:Hpha_TRINITY_DN15567_c0_g2::TRINITY_DN15567_c0_g2_i2::g.106567::m.106567/K01135/ARSB; arylsulfatase B
MLALTIAAAVCAKPHIIFNVVDDLGWNDVGWHDEFGQLKTPKLNKIVKEEAVELNQYYVYRFCSPSRSTFQTGRYPWHIGQQTKMNLNPTPGIACGINLNYTFMAGVLKQAGYSTHALGKWHLGFQSNDYTPTYRGFDTFLGYYSGAEEHFTHGKSGAWQGISFYDLANNTGKEIKPCLSAVGNATGADGGVYSSYLYGNETLRILNAHDPSTPLYLYLAWDNVHDPCQAPQNYIDINSDISNGGRRAFCAMMSALDDAVPTIIATLKEKKMWDNTIYVWTTDNGGNLMGDGINYPLRGGKYTFWQGGVRGNAFVTGGMVPAALRGGSWDGRMHAADWYTTFAKLAGVSADHTGDVAPDGVDIWEALSSGGTSPRTEVVLQILTNSTGNSLSSDRTCSPGNLPLCWDQDEPETFASGASDLVQGAIIQGKWKLLYGYPGWGNGGKFDDWDKPPSFVSEDVKTPTNPPCGASPCLFDIVSDPTEHHDVSAANPELVANMTARLRELAAKEVTVRESGLCPTEYFDKKDPRCFAKAKEVGFWMPWL